MAAREYQVVVGGELSDDAAPAFKGMRLERREGTINVLAERIAVIAAGRIVAEGDPDTLGGRASAAARVGWDPPTGGRRTVETGTPTATIAELAGEFGGEIPGLTVTRPTLEDVYLDLIAAAGGDEQS